MKLAVTFLATIGPTGRFAPAANTVARTSALNMVQQLDLKTGQSQLDTSVVDRFSALPYPDDKVLAEYVWVDAKGECRSKTRTLPVARTEAVDKLPNWNFDGSSTDQAPGDDSEVILRPCRIFKDPFRPRAHGLDNNLVMCDTYTPAGEAIPTNTRAIAAKAFEGKEDEEVWFGLEQEFTPLQPRPTHSPRLAQEPVSQPRSGPYYSSAGPENSFGRAVTDAMYRCCLYAGLEISGTNGEVMPGQQEYQIGPCVGIDAGDQLFMSRYILQRVCEEFQVYCTLHPKPITDEDWNGAGMHTNDSTKSMREAGGLDIIKQAIYKLGAKHKEHIAIYGEGNELRLTGKFETASMDEFSFGVANRGASVRIGRDTEAEEMLGYFEDRKPQFPNADPYLVTGKRSWLPIIMEDIEVS
uniref:Glutamine synthetase n=1 Tax=Skeletonema costatum TaxID=2843 RepID=O96463_SKECO|nr:glutamine synthetase [Skeletonema costatum]